MKRKGSKRSQIIAALDKHGGLAPGVCSAISKETGIPEADVYGVATFYSLLANPGIQKRVCQGLSCLIAGAPHPETLEEGAEAVHCLGQCDRAPVMLDADLELLTAGPRGAVTPDDGQLPINLGGADLADYAMVSQLRKRGADWVLGELKASQLQGRGGAGFSAAFKWNSVRSQGDPTHYVVVNADESEPGTFKDREIMLRRPHLMLQGAAIAAEVVGATTLYIYVRGEFKACIRSLEKAIEEAKPHIGHLDIRLVHGHGAYICGEETALLESIEGKRGMPRLKPPFPTVVGLWGHPTLVNNVETLACVPSILARGGAWFKSLGRSEPGSKLYCLSGHVVNPGVYELPLGVTLDELVKVGGGYVGEPKAFSPGGAASGFLSMDYRDRPLDFKGMADCGAMLGSAGVVVLNTSVDMAQASLWQAIFFEDETCGQCAPCRIGCRLQRRALSQYLENGDATALEHVADVAWEMEEGSICGLGMTASLPVVSAMKHFPLDFGPRPAKS